MDPLGIKNHRRGKLGSSLLFFGTAAITGVLFNLLLFRFYSPQNSALIVNEPINNEDHCASQAVPSSVPTVPSTSVHWQANDKSLNELRDMVAKTKGYYGRDWSLGLGWNNVC